jgi:hypothetical protein
LEIVWTFFWIHIQGTILDWLTIHGWFSHSGGPTHISEEALNPNKKNKCFYYAVYHGYNTQFQSGLRNAIPGGVSMSMASPP